MKIEDYIGKNISEYDIKDFVLPITDDFGNDLRFTNVSGKKLKSYVSREKNGYREVKLDIHSYRGAIGAIHYYGRLKSYSLHFTEENDKECRSSIGGYGTVGVPDIYKDFFELELKRPVTREDFNDDKEFETDRWHGYDLGDLTNAFYDEQEIVDLAKKIFKCMFKGKWILVVDSYSGKEYPVVKLKA